MEYHSGGSLPLLGRPRYCPGANANGGYLCETGHCCGESGCCTYYYELWWFWLLWTVLILFSCCCAYRHRRAKLRLQQQQRQRDISLLAYQGASSFPSSMLDLSFLASLKLPSYEEVAAQPSTPPPPYSSVFTAPRYPQPPRTAHPHLLSQHPGAPHPGAPHRPLQPLSDGPSSLSSDNSSSCSCDSCCPSSPCSSSLSAPVTYETDTSHASTPSEAAPLALDPVAMETISAAAARLAPSVGSRDDPASVAILIERTEPAAAVAFVAAGSASPSETKASPDLGAAFPVGITAPIKQQLDVATVSAPACVQSTERSASPEARTLDNTSSKQPRTLTLILDSVGGNTDHNPSLVPISVSPQNPPRAASSEEAHCSKAEVKVSKLTPNTSPTQASPSSRTVHSIDALHSSNNSPNSADLSPPSQGIAHFSTKPAGESSELTAEAPNVTKQSGETGYSLNSPSITIDTTSQAPGNPLEDSKTLRTCELSKSTEMVATNAEQLNEKACENSTQNLSDNIALASPQPVQTSTELPQSPKSQAATSTPISDPIIFSLDAKSESPAFAETRELVAAPPQASQPAESVSISMPETFDSECPSTLLSQDGAAIEERAKASSQGNISASSQLYTEIPPLMPDPSAQPTSKANSIAADVFSPTLDRETGRMCATNSDTEQKPADSEVVKVECSLTNLPDASSSFPAIAIEADPPSFANVISPTFDRETGRISTTNSNTELKPATSEVSSSEHSATLAAQNKNSNSRDNIVSSSQLKTEIPPLTPDPSAQPTTKADSVAADVDSPTGRMSATKPADSKLLHLEHALANLAAQNMNSNPPEASSLCPAVAVHGSVVSPTFDRETGKLSSTNFEVEQKSIDSELLSLERSLNANLDSSSFFPAITIHADPPSFAASPSSIPSPSLPQSPTSGATLLLDPLAALQPSDRSAASSGHASSLSPSPRNTQSPPKQTLFSPCVDVFEPVDPNWEDDESEEQPDEEYCEDSDVAADESQYRHRRLTGDSGIEVCRCRVEDEDEEEEDDEGGERSEKAPKQDGGEKKPEVHDSVDCPVRSRRSSAGDDGGLCNNEASAEKVAIPVETV